MNSGYVKGTIVFICLTVVVFISGCSMNKKAAMPPGKTLVIELNDNPDYQPLLTGKPQTCGMRSGRVYLKPGEECGRHSTKTHEETLVFLSGKGTALVGEEGNALDVGRGKVCYIPPDTLHNIKNTGNEPLVYIYCVAPADSRGKKGHRH
jgi:mannose-6-phosphate isomerase-like protein (cupin superfamily)